MGEDKDGLSFKGVAQFNIPSVGCVHIVKNPRSCDNFLWLEKKEVEVDGRKFVVAGIRFREDASHQSDRKVVPEGEFIGLLEVVK